MMWRPSTGSSAQAPPPPIWRRLFHLVAGTTLPVIGLVLPHWWAIGVLAALAAVSLILDLTRFQFPALNRLFLAWLAPLLKSRESRKITGATFMCVAALCAFLIFREPVAAAALLCLSLGDPAAALAGQRASGPRAWGKSPVGTVAFAGAASLGALALVGAGATPLHWGLFLGAAMAAIVELLPLPVDDNLTIPLAAAVVMQVAGVGS